MKIQQHLNIQHFVICFLNCENKKTKTKTMLILKTTHWTLPTHLVGPGPTILTPSQVTGKDQTPSSSLRGVRLSRNNVASNHIINNNNVETKIINNFTSSTRGSRTGGRAGKRPREVEEGPDCPRITTCITID